MTVERVAGGKKCRVWVFQTPRLIALGHFAFLKYGLVKEV
jgi:hypothetical protein